MKRIRKPRWLTAENFYAASVGFAVLALGAAFLVMLAEAMP